MKYVIKIVINLLLILLLFNESYGQNLNNNKDFITYYNKKDYSKSLAIIEKYLSYEYSKRIQYKRIPSNLITLKGVKNDTDLKKIFRNRKVKNFFIEPDNRLHILHLYAGRCYYNLKKYKNSINHYIQSLRFTEIDNKSDKVFYELSQVYKNFNKFDAYTNTLELAYTINPDNYKYSYELGISLSKTKQKKKSIYHLKRFIKNSEKDHDPKLYLTIGNLYEDIGKYIETEQYYKKYLELKPEDPYISFSLAFIAFKRTGNYSLAVKLFNRSLNILPENDIYRRSKSFEFLGDIAYRNLEYSKAIENYNKTIEYQRSIMKDIRVIEDKISELNKKINELRTSLMKDPEFDEYSTYEFVLEDAGSEELKLKKMQSQLKKMNPGKVRWFIADAMEKTGNLIDAVKFYRNAITYNYNPGPARERITKLQLKIKRGY